MRIRTNPARRKWLNEDAARFLILNRREKALLC